MRDERTAAVADSATATPPTSPASRPGHAVSVGLDLGHKGSDLSIKIIEAVWDVRVGSPTDKLVLLALADYANDRGRCWPSVPALMQRTELSDRAVRTAIKRLSAAGHVEVIHRQRHSSIFTLHQVPPTLHQVPLSPAPGAARTVIDPSLNLRDKVIHRKSAEDRELETRARDLCFRIRMSDESAAAYRAALQRFEAENTVTVAYLKDHAARRRKNADF